MGLRQAMQQRVGWSDVVGVGVMSIAAPWVAAYVHSACVLHRGTRLYNAEVASLPDMAFACAVPALPTFLFLLAFRKRAVTRWLAWLGSIAFWTWVAFKLEYVMR